MIFIQLPEEHDALGFLALATSGTPVTCWPKNTYGVSTEHLRLLRRKHIPFKKIERGAIRPPQPSRPHDEKV